MLDLGEQVTHRVRRWRSAAPVAAVVSLGVTLDQRLRHAIELIVGVTRSKRTRAIRKQVARKRQRDEWPARRTPHQNIVKELSSAGVEGRAQRVLIGLIVLIGALASPALVAVDSEFVAAAGSDARRGALLFARLPCASCHDTTRRSPGGDVCPNLGDIATEGARIVRRRDYRGKAKDAAGYIRESIVDPNAYLVPGANYRSADGQSIMPKTFGETLRAAEIDDLVAFLLTRR